MCAGPEETSRAESALRPQALDTCVSGLFTHVKLLLASTLSQLVEFGTGLWWCKSPSRTADKDLPEVMTAISSSAWLM